MEGQTFSHYRVLEKLGGGGMGVVYKALDTHLDRHVALKFLPSELTRDEAARHRFIQEAKAASALDHPNICTIHEIDATSEGQQFIVMAYYEGETLKNRIARGPLPVEDALDIAIQVAQGLAEAHAADIVHRDIKPANVMLTKNGLVKIVDFGIAKLLGVTGPTQTGTTLGTVAYMSPEQVSGEEAEQRSDVWAVGVILYEMLTGQLPFRGEQPAVQLSAILNTQPKPISELRADLPADLQQIPAKALEKQRERRYQSASELRKDLASSQLALAAPPPTVTVTAVSQVLRRPSIAVPALVALLAIGAAAIWAWNQGADARWAREEGMPQLMQLVEEGNYTEAFEIAERVAESIPDDPTLASVWPQISTSASLQTTPAGAEVYVKDYADTSGDWRFVGVTPIVDVRIASGPKRWEIRQEGFQTRSLAVSPERLGVPSLNPLVLDEQGSVPVDMVRIPGGRVAAWITGIDPFENAVPMDDFFIDKYEVTNEQFKEFIDAGGFQDRQYWIHEFSADGQVLSWDEAMAQFVGVTGRPGPSTWELGDYPDGEQDYPVTGISWYEAAAYAEFTGKSLPTITHWIRAATTFSASYLTPLSNLQGTGPARVGSRQAISMFGTHDMAGNVREWCWNLSEADRRYILGGAWSDPAYVFTYANVQSPFDRSPTNGFRLIQHVGASETPEAATRPVPLLTRDYTQEQPVADDVFQVYQDQFSYDQTDLDAVVEALPVTSDDWTGERVTLNVAYGNERMTVDVYLPAPASPPHCVFRPIVITDSGAT